MNTFFMTITLKAIQDLLDDLEASKESRLRAWDVLQRIRLVLSEVGNTEIPPPAQKTFNAEGEVLGHVSDEIFRIRNDAIKSWCSSVRQFRDATIEERPQKRLLRKALDREEDLIQTVYTAKGRPPIGNYQTFEEALEILVWKGRLKKR